MGLHCGHLNRVKSLKILCVATVTSSIIHLYLNIDMAMVRINYTGFRELVKIVQDIVNSFLEWTAENCTGYTTLGEF